MASSSAVGRRQEHSGAVHKWKHGRHPSFPQHFFKDLKGKPARVAILGETLSVRTWKGVLLETCRLMKERHGDDYKRILGLGGSKNPWFSNDPNRLRRPERLPGTNIYAETNWSALNVVRICQHILALFGEEPTVEVATE